MTGNQSVVGYVRVSTEEQGVSGLGLEAQRKAIADECARRDWNLVRIEEDMLSGRTLNRPGLQRALDAQASGEVQGIVVAKLDRLSRSIVDFAGLLDRARRGGWNVVALDLGVDLSTPSGEFLANVMASAAQWERRIIGARTRDALAARKARGERLGRPVSIPTDVTNRVRELRARGSTLQAICSQLNAESVPTPRGGKLWRPSSIQALLRSKT